MGKDGSGALAEGGTWAVKTFATRSDLLTTEPRRGGCRVGNPDPVVARRPPASVKPPPDRLYGRARGHKLRLRQARLLNVTLPRLAVPGKLPDGTLWLEVGFGGGEHALAQVRAHPEATLIACEVFENGICSLLSALVAEGEEATAPASPQSLPLDRRCPATAENPPRCLPGPAVPDVPRSMAEGTSCQAPLHSSGATTAPGSCPETWCRMARGKRRSDLSGLGARSDGVAGSVHRRPTRSYKAGRVATDPL